MFRLISCLILTYKGIETFRLLEKHFMICPITALELVPFARRKRPNVYPLSAEVGVEEIVAMENGGALPSDPVGQAIDSLSWSTSKGVSTINLYSPLYSVSDMHIVYSVGTPYFRAFGGLP